MDRFALIVALAVSLVAYCAYSATRHPPLEDPITPVEISVAPRHAPREPKPITDDACRHFMSTTNVCQLTT